MQPVWAATDSQIALFKADALAELESAGTPTARFALIRRVAFRASILYLLRQACIANPGRRVTSPNKNLQPPSRAQRVFGFATFCSRDLRLIANPFGV